MVELKAIIFLGSNVLIYLTLLYFLLHYVHEYSKIWNIAKSNNFNLFLEVLRLDKLEQLKFKLKKKLRLRNMQEKLENEVSNQGFYSTVEKNQMKEIYCSLECKSHLKRLQHSVFSTIRDLHLGFRQAQIVL